MKSAGRWVVALGASGVGLWFALRGAQWASVGEALRTLRAPAFLLLIPVAGAVEFALRTWRWNLLLAPLRPASFRVFYPVTAASFFLNNALPFRAGEAARVWWTHEKASLPVSSALALLMIDRVFDMLSILTLVGLAMAGSPGLLPTKAPVISLAAAAVCGLAGLMAVAHFPGFFRGLADRPMVPAKLKAWAHQFIEGSVALRRPVMVPALYVVSILFWLMNVSLYQFIAQLFSINITWVQTAWLIVAFCFATMLPAAPGYVGTLEAAGVVALGWFGYDKARALPFVLVLHFSQILSTALLGVPSLLWAGLKVQRGAPDPGPRARELERRA